jgi:tetratricopeptide (TPR) repeat protein
MTTDVMKVSILPGWSEAKNASRGVTAAQFRICQESDKAIEDCSQAIRLNPNDATAFSSCGVAYQFKGQFDRAIEDYDRSIRIDPDYAMALMGRAYPEPVCVAEHRFKES